MEFNYTINIRGIDVDAQTHQSPREEVSESPYLTEHGVEYSSRNIIVEDTLVTGFRINLDGASVSGRIRPTLIENAPAAILKAAGPLNWEAVA
jgi:hypothetical protein